MYYVCILYSKSRDRFYIGHTEDVEDGFIRHNQGRSKATKAGRPWRLVCSEQFATRSEAMRREQQIKQMKDRSYILSLVKVIQPE